MSTRSYDRMSPEFALVEALRTVPALQDPDGGEPKVAAMQPKKSWRAPFVFYIPQEDSEERALDGPTGLQSFAATLHCVGGTHRGLQLLCQRCRKALREMPGSVYSTPEEDTGEGPKGRILVEDLDLEQGSPDLYEAEVSLYRRIYTVRIHFQTEEVYEDEEVPSA
ncbi:MAG: hypothetical protein K6C12_03210 [Oscillospiraceae bacterium]|nr:hypothetical protein [Oscillospiraceae bacterium]